MNPLYLCNEFMDANAISTTSDNNINVNQNRSFINKKTSAIPKSAIRRSKSLHNSSQQRKISIDGNHFDNKHLVVNAASIKNNQINQHEIQKPHHYHHHYGFKRHFSNNDCKNNEEFIPSHWLINPRTAVNSITNARAPLSSCSNNHHQHHELHGSFSSELSNVSNNSSHYYEANRNPNYFQNQNQQKSLKTKQEQQFDSRHFDLNKQLNALSLSPNDDNDNFRPILNSSQGISRGDLLKWKSLLFNGDSDDEDDDLDLDDYDDVDEESGDYDDETFDLLANTNYRTDRKKKIQKSFTNEMTDWQSYSQSRKKQLKFSYKFYMIQQKNYPSRYINNNDNNNFQIKSKSIHRILVLGYPNSGKTSLIKEFKTIINQNPNCSFNPIDSDELNKPKNLLVHFLEIDSLDEYQLQTIVVNYQPDIYLILYSIDSRDSFNDVKKTLFELPKWDDIEEKVKIIVANKCDLERSRRITIKEARDFATKNNCKFIELSCALSHNINVLLQGIGAQIDLKKKQRLKQEKAYKISKESSSNYLSKYSTETDSKLKRGTSFFQKILRKVVINKSKSCNNLNVL